MAGRRVQATLYNAPDPWRYTGQAHSPVTVISRREKEEAAMSKRFVGGTFVFVAVFGLIALPAMAQ